VVGFLNGALKWSVKHGSGADGDARLHLAFARAYRTRGDLGVCQQYYAKSRTPDEFAEVLQQYIPKTLPSEHDLVIARAVLLYVEENHCIGNGIDYCLF